MTAPHYKDGAVTLFHADCLDLLAELDDCSVDAVVTDPPYGLEFMGREWDSFGRANGRDDLRHSARMTNAPEPVAGKPWASERKSYGAVKKNPRCKVCGRLRFDHAGRACACAQPAWDLRIAESMAAYQAWCAEWAAECLRVLKPGGHLLAFGGTRTSHRLTCAVEDAGFEVRDSIMWIYGSGFPKSLDVSKALDKAAGAERDVIGKHPRPAGNKPGGASLVMSATGMPETAELTAPATDDAKRWAGWGTALKPAHEPIVVARKPLVGSVAANVLAFGVGGLNVDGCRVATADGRPAWSYPNGPGGKSMHYSSGDRGTRPNASEGDASGRWPSNVVWSHLPDCNGACADGCGVAELDRQSGTLAHNAPAVWRGGTDAGVFGTVGSARPGDIRGGYADAGGASRFFPVFRYEAKAPSVERPREDGAAHPTVKPLDLMRWLVRLVTPPGGLVLEPFAGSGTTAEACVIEGLRCIAVEREPTYLPLIVQRLAKPLQPVLL